MTPNDNVRAEIDALAARTHAAMARRDLDAVLATMTEDVVLLTATGSPVVGHDAVRQFYAGLIETFVIQHTATSADFTLYPTGETLMVVGIDSATVTPVDGSSIIKLQGPAVSVFRRVDGVWKLARSLNLMEHVT